MMHKFLILLLTSLLFYSCNTESEIQKEFNCEMTNFKDLEKVEDVKNLFSVQIPTTWKTNLYQDEIQSSIFTADTTKQLTETILFDVTFIQKKVDFNEVFKLKQEQEDLGIGLIQVKHKEYISNGKEAYFTLSRGKKGNYPYQLFRNFIKINNQNFILAKIELYGDSLVNQRFCKALSLINNIKKAP